MVYCTKMHRRNWGLKCGPVGNECKDFWNSAEDDPALYDKIVEVIIRKEEETPTGRIMDVDAAWAEFKEHYMTPEGVGMRLYDDEEYGEDAEDPPKSHPPKRRLSCTARRSLAVAAVLVVLLVGMCIVQATGVNILGSIAQWTDEVLHFTSSTEPSQIEVPSVADITDTSNPLQIALTENGFNSDLAPTWLPPEFDMGEIKHAESKAFNKVSCRFSNVNKAFEIQFVLYKETPSADSAFYEKDSNEVEEYVSNNRLFYIVSNVDQQMATWTDGDISIKISGDISNSDLKKIVDSIGG